MEYEKWELSMDIRTWADGFGNWHATVPLSTWSKADKRLAKAAIMWQIQSRQLVPLTRKGLQILYVGTDNGRRHYVESA